MSENRQGWRSRRWGWLLVLIVWFTLEAISPSWGNPLPLTGKGVGGEQSPVVLLSGEFFQAMEKLSNSGEVSGDRQELFLKQIATAQRFVVKTNLTFIEQNGKIIRLLEEPETPGAEGKPLRCLP